MTSANTPEKKEKLKGVDGNFPIAPEDKQLFNESTDNRYSYAEVNQFFYFDKNKIKYTKIGSMEEDILDLIIEYIEELNKRDVEFVQILDKAQRIQEE